MKSTQKSGGNQQTVRGVVVVVYYRRLLFHSFFFLSFNIERTGINGQTEKKNPSAFHAPLFSFSSFDHRHNDYPWRRGGHFYSFFFIPSYAKWRRERERRWVVSLSHPYVNMDNGYSMRFYTPFCLSFSTCRASLDAILYLSSPDLCISFPMSVCACVCVCVCVYIVFGQWLMFGHFPSTLLLLLFLHFHFHSNSSSYSIWLIDTAIDNLPCPYRGPPSFPSNEYHFLLLNFFPLSSFYERVERNKE